MGDVVNLQEYRELKAARVRNEQYMREQAAARRRIDGRFYFPAHIFKKKVDEPPEATK